MKRGKKHPAFQHKIRTRETFMIIDTLIEKIIATQNPTCVGLDTQLSYLPEEMRAGVATPEQAADAILAFNKKLVDSVADIVPSVKVQIAYYEQYGAAGVQAFFDTCRYARDKGLVVIADCKRNDIGSTAARYSAAYLGTTELGGERLPSARATSSPSTGISARTASRPFWRTARRTTRASSCWSRRATPLRASCRT